MPVLKAKQIGPQQGAHGHGVVHGRTGVALCAVEGKEEVQPARDGLRHGVADGADARKVLGIEQSLLRDIQPGHGDGQAGAEHDVRRLGVRENVEFGCRRPVSVGKAAAHQADARDVRLQLRVSQQQGGDVRQGSRGHDGQRLGAFAQQAGHLLRRALVCGLTVRLRQGGAVQPAHAVHARGGERLGQQRPGKAHGHRRPDAEQRAYAQGVARCFFNGLVPGDRADAADV